MIMTIEPEYLLGTRIVNKNGIPEIYVRMKPKTKQQKTEDCFTAYEALKNGQTPERTGATDGSIPTHPVVPCPALPEAAVLNQCRRWLTSHRIFHDRHGCGGGDLGGGYAQYGIKDAGDIIGILHNGQHFEIETKAGKGGRLSLGQQKRKIKVEANNALYFVIHGVPELEHYFKGII